MRLSYVGTRYRGWQRQKDLPPEHPSVQATLEDALQRITGEKASVVGSGRTDSGVHAAGQVAHFTLKRRCWDPSILHKAFNSTLPPDIRALEVNAVPLAFHAQRSALKKQYSYFFQQGPCALPYVEPYSWWLRRRLDEKAMQKALNALIGRHDFKPFQASGAHPGPTVREILEAEVTRVPFEFPPGGFEWVRVRLVGTGFLKQMVRGIVGTLHQVGDGRRSPRCLADILASGRRQDVGPTAPARALWLERVWYPEA